MDLNAAAWTVLLLSLGARFLMSLLQGLGQGTFRGEKPMSGYYAIMYALQVRREFAIPRKTLSFLPCPSRGRRADSNGHAACAVSWAFAKICLHGFADSGGMTSPLGLELRLLA